MKMDPMDHLSPAEALVRLKQLIHTGKYGINYLFEPTEKNYLYVFIKKGVSLLPRYAKVFEYSVVDIYIKFFFCNEKQSCVVILSFHKTGDY